MSFIRVQYRVLHSSLCCQNGEVQRAQTSFNLLCKIIHCCVTKPELEAPSVSSNMQLPNQNIQTPPKIVVIETSEVQEKHIMYLIMQYDFWLRHQPYKSKCQCVCLSVCASQLLQLYWTSEGLPKDFGQNLIYKSQPPSSRLVIFHF